MYTEFFSFQFHTVTTVSSAADAKYGSVVGQNCTFLTPEECPLLTQYQQTETTKQRNDDELQQLIKRTNENKDSCGFRMS